MLRRTSLALTTALGRGFTSERLERLADDYCTDLVQPEPETIHNVAVPGTFLRDLFPGPGDGGRENPLASMMLGGRTQLEAARAAQPTFATVEFGLEDLLHPFVGGVPPTSEAINETYGADLPRVQ